MASTKDLAIISNDIYNAPENKKKNAPRNIEGTNWYLEGGSYYESENTGFQAGVYRNRDTDERVIAYAGTNGLEDIDDDIAIGMGGTVQQAEQALSYFDRKNSDGTGQIFHFRT